ARDAAAVVGGGRRDAGDVRAVTVVVGAAVDALAGVAARAEARDVTHDAIATEVLVGDVDARVDDGDRRARARGRAPRRGRPDHLEVPLQPEAGVVGGRRQRALGRGHEGDA